MLLTSVNESEITVGYCASYGDLCGALEVSGNLYKTEAFNLALLLEREPLIIPESTLAKPLRGSLSRLRQIMIASNPTQFLMIY
jgi:NH3-dependent NAD+ synthetase